MPGGVNSCSTKTYRAAAVVLGLVRGARRLETEKRAGRGLRLTPLFYHHRECEHRKEPKMGTFSFEDIPLVDSATELRSRVWPVTSPATDARRASECKKNILKDRIVDGRRRSDSVQSGQRPKL